MIRCGIYKIEDVRTGNVYVGSANDIKKRWSNNLAKLRANKHPYKELQDAWNESEDNIKFEILWECPEWELAEKEIDYMNHINRVDGWTLINKTQRINRHKVADVTKMRESQTGSLNGHARLSEQDVKEILWLKANDYKIMDIADKYSVSATHISNIGREKWVHINEMIKPDWVDDREVS